MCVFSKEETVNFKQFMRVLARFRPTKTNVNKNKLNTREEKLKCKCILDTWVVNAVLLKVADFLYLKHQLVSNRRDKV